MPRQVHHRENPHRAGAEDEQGDAGDQRGDVGVEDGVEGAVVAGGDGRLGLEPLRSSSRMRSLISTLASMAMPRVSAMAAMPGRVRVACSSDSSATSKQQVGGQRHHRHEAEQHVVGAHEDGDGDEAPHGRVEALLVMFSAPRLGPMVRSSMISIGAASEPARSSRGRCRWPPSVLMRPGDLHAAAADLAADHRAVTTSPLPFSISRMAIRLPMFSRVMSPRRCGRRRRRGSGGPPARGSGRRSRLGVGEALAGEDDLLLDQQRVAAALGVELGARRDGAPQRAFEAPGCRPPGGSRGSRCGRGCPWPCHVPHARQLHDDAVEAPCCWITGSATPSSLIRLCRVPMFWRRRTPGWSSGPAGEGGGELEVGAVLAFDGCRSLVPAPITPSRGPGFRRRGT